MFSRRLSSRLLVGSLLLGLLACGNSSTGTSSTGGAANTAGTAGQSAGGKGATGGTLPAGQGAMGGVSVAGGGAGGTLPMAMAGSAGMVTATGGASGSGGTPTSAIGSGLPIDPHLVGQNYWGEGDIEALWPVVQASGVTLVRFGGAGADDEQPSNQRFADVAAAIRLIGAEPYLQVSRHFDAARAKQVVDFVNNTQHEHVVYWSINNEPDIGANEPLMSVTDSANLVKSLASAMKEADPTIKIFAPELAYYDEAYLGPMLGGASDITGKDASGRYYIDGVSFHGYPFGADYTRDQAVGAPAGFRSNVGKLLTALASSNQKNGRSGATALKWALTEFNMTYQNPTDNSVDSFGVNSFLNGQFFAEIYGIGMASGAVTVAPWSVHESNGNRGPSDLGYLDGPVASAKPRSSYYHLQLIAQNFKGRYAPATSSQPLLRVVASGDGTQVSVLLLNESVDQNYDFGVRLDKGALTQPKAVTVSVDAAVSAEYASTVAAQSSLLLVFDQTGKLTKRVEYAIADARSATAPRVVQ